MSDSENSTNSSTTGQGGKARTWQGRYVNIAHRRTPSELTPLVQQNLALQQQVEMLTAQNQHMMHQQMSAVQPPPLGAPQSVYIAPPQLLPPPPQVFHSRAGSHSSNQLSPSGSQHGRQRSMGHVRRHSLAVSEAMRAAQERSSGGSPTLQSGPQLFSTSPGQANSPLSVNNPVSTETVPQFRFPPSPDRPEHVPERTGRGHNRSQSSSSFRRQTPSPQRFQFPPSADSQGLQNLQPPPPLQAGHHSRRTSNWQSDSFSGSFSHRSRPSNASDFSPNQQQHAQAGRKSLFVPYLPQATIPEMLSEGLLVTGTLRVNHKNRSYAYVHTDLLDAEVLIAGSKDRNRALEGDLVAVELLDVDDVWEQKREKEERKRRRGGGESNDGRLVETQEGQLRRRGSLKQRAPQKRSDDVEVEGQTLLLREDFGSGEEKPLYSGHVVAILERPAGQLFSGTLGLLRPSSQATKERQQPSHSRHASGSSIAADDPPQNQNKPKIAWFKPVDKCVPLMAIPIEQAPPDLVENPGSYAGQIFVAQVKRWPITSLHPFGMLVEKLGPSGSMAVSKKAVLRDFNFGAHKFGDGAIDEAIAAGQAMANAATALPRSQATSVALLAPDLAASLYERDGEQIVAIHVLDVTPFIVRNGLLDRELRHKSAGVYMENFESPLVDSLEALEQIWFKEGRRSPALTVELAKDSRLTTIKREAVAPTQGTEGIAEFEGIASVLRRRRGLGSLDEAAVDLSALLDVCVPPRPPLTDPTREQMIVGELVHAANAAVASELLRSSAVGLNTLVRRQAEPPLSKLEQLAGLLRSQGVRVDTTNAHTLSRSLAEELSPRQITAIKAPLIKILHSQRYAVAARTNPGQLGHYWFGFDAYTHFARPLLRYADQVVARQVHTMLGTSSEYEDQFNSGAAELAAELSFRYDCARGVQEQSFHLGLAHTLSDSYQLMGAIVTSVYESAFDIVIPELSVEKRVHGDQLPLSKAEFHPSSQLLELHWTPGQDSALFEPEIEDKSGFRDDAERARTGDHAPPIPEGLHKSLTLHEATHVQEIKPMFEIPILVRMSADSRVLPSVTVRAANPFL